MAIATVPIADFVSYVAPEVNQCPIPAIERAIENTVIEFCDRTWIHQIDFTFNITDDEVMEELNDAVDLDLDGVQNLRPIEVLQIQVDGANIELKERGFVEAFPEWWDDAGGNVVFWFIVDNDTIRVYPVPVQDFTLFMRVAFKPQRAAVVFWEDIYKDWIETIAAGAKYRLFQIPNKPWTNPELTLLNRMNYENGISTGKILVRRNYLPLRVFKKGFI